MDSSETAPCLLCAGQGRSRLYTGTRRTMFVRNIALVRRYRPSPGFRAVIDACPANPPGMPGDSCWPNANLPDRRSGTRDPRPRTLPTYATRHQPVGHRHRPGSWSTVRSAIARSIPRLPPSHPAPPDQRPRISSSASGSLSGQTARASTPQTAAPSGKMGLSVGGAHGWFARSRITPLTEITCTRLGPWTPTPGGSSGGGDRVDAPGETDRGVACGRGLVSTLGRGW